MSEKTKSERNERFEMHVDTLARMEMWRDLHSGPRAGGRPRAGRGRLHGDQHGRRSNGVPADRVMAGQTSGI